MSLSISLALEDVHLDNECTTINGVNNNKPTGESIVAPGTEVPNSVAATRLVVIPGVHIKVRNLLDALARRLPRDGADIENAKTSLIVRLVSKSVVDELVVIDRADARLVVSGVGRLLEVRDVENVSDRESILRRRLWARAVRVKHTLV